MTALKIDESNARKLYPTASPEFKQMLIDTFGQDFFNAMPTTWEAICVIAQLDPVTSLPHPQPKHEEDEYDNAVFRLRTTAKVLRKGAVLSHYNKKQEKWAPYFTATSSGFGFSSSTYGNVRTLTFVGSHLSVHDKKTSDHFGKYFISDWEIFYTK